MIQLVGIAKSFGHRTLFSGLTLAVESGRTVVIAGASGSGKSTLLRLIAGLDQPGAGEIRLTCGVVSSQHRFVQPHERGVAMSFQEPVLWPHMDIRSNIRFARPQLPDRELDSTLDALDLRGVIHSRPAALSGGEARRVDLARAVLSRHPILLLDEPLTHLDPALSDRVFDWLQRETAGLTRIVVTHGCDSAHDWSGATLTLAGGQLIQA